MPEENKSFPHKEESFQIIGSAMEVLNEMGHGFHEKPYENALVVEFGLRGIECVQQERYEMAYKGVKVGEYIPDLIVYGKVVVDTKTIAEISDCEVGQMLNYLKITGLLLGLILNFKKPQLEWKRVVLQENGTSTADERGGTQIETTRIGSGQSRP